VFARRLFDDCTHKANNNYNYNDNNLPGARLGAKKLFEEEEDDMLSLSVWCAKDDGDAPGQHR
jgi:hypothetical protein